MFKKGSFEIGGTIHPVAIKVKWIICPHAPKGGSDMVALSRCDLQLPQESLCVLLFRFTLCLPLPRFLDHFSSLLMCM